MPRRFRRSLTDKMPDRSDLDVELNIRTVVSQYGVYWHKLLVEITVWVLAVCLGLASFSISQKNLSTIAWVAICIFILAVAMVGLALHGRIVQQTGEQRGILARLDTKHGLFVVGRYIPKQTIYPCHWKNEDAINLEIDPIENFTFHVMWVLPTLLAIGVGLAHYFGWLIDA